MEYGTTNQTKSVLWSWIKQHDNILWMGLFLIVCACLVVGCSPAVEDPQTVAPEESTTEMVSDEVTEPVRESTAVPAETETEPLPMTYDRLPVPTYSDTTYPYYVEELDVTLDIPEGMHVYRTDSIRRHWNGEWFRLGCSQWILVTDKDYEQSYVDNGLMTDLGKEAKHLVFGLVVTEKKLAPLARLFPGVVPCSEVRVTEDWYCEILRDPTRLMTEDGGYGKLPAEDCVRWYDTDLSARLTGRIREKTLGTAGVTNEGEYLLTPSLVSEEPYLYTMLNPDWWQGYCHAVEELTHQAKSYQYSQEDIDEILRRVEDHRARASAYWPDGREMTDSYIDQSEDIYLRASYYADSYAYYKGDVDQATSLEDVVVSFQTWSDSQRSYYVMRKDDGFAYGTSDYMVDLQPSYEYLKEHDLLLDETVK